MEKLFGKERQVLKKAEELLRISQFDSDADQKNYRILYEEYKVLLRQSIRVVHLADRVQLELKTLLQELEQISKIDPLTKLYNRSFFMNCYLEEWKKAEQAENSLSVLMVDIDFFKEYNDTYGHIQGDTCLQLIAEQFVKNITAYHGLAGRFGGDEFIILLPGTDLAGAELVSEKIIQDVRDLQLEHTGSKTFGKVTVSIGATAIIPTADIPFMSFLQHADQALYQAKRAKKKQR